MTKTVDTIIGGGGMVGLALGIALAKGGLDVVVADPVPEARALAAGFDGRVSALAFASVRMFKALGIWDHLAPHAQPIDDILVTDAKLGAPPSPFSLHFDHRELGAPLGFIAENRHIRSALFAAARGVTNLQLMSPAALVDLEAKANAIEARLDDGATVTARLAVAADGRESPIRARMGINVVSWSYPQWGIVATVHHERPHRGVAYEHFLPSGPFAILPLTGNRSSLVWTERDTVAPAMMDLPQADFDAEIARRFGAHLGKTRAEELRWSYPLRFHLARAYVKPRFALTGDAAHGIHPIAGQGLNLGLRDAAALADVALEAASLGLDPGGIDVLSRYERWRRFDSFTMAMAMDGLNRLFSNDIAPLRLARDLGMGIVDRIGPMRRFFMRHAGGDVGRLPRLMREEAA
ncbi:MAG: FAD-dependent monooxygenase [Alphaproteobacteria bacterium]|nr:FAD-dependent monooxygenase [Alphaproteobacteria bacterium]MDE2112775.1 FAD-dependent monooxygenase [Alphaproteobacteria bacterium]MDE2493288.1 FAD-dependent monooxygenase [Alphaproteobacteria bacterium]